jgi:hypothetical protein
MGNASQVWEKQLQQTMSTEILCVDTVCCNCSSDTRDALPIKIYVTMLKSKNLCNKINATKLQSLTKFCYTTTTKSFFSWRKENVVNGIWLDMETV